LEQYKRNCLIGFDIRTGRTHQIRVHAKFIGTPLAFDPLYNPQNGIFVSQLKPKFKQTLEEERSIIQRLSLHSQSLAFVHPITQEEHYIECPYPKDFEKALDILRKYNN
jgi:23S rRNA-/tRNA-specific pseudouridylate synthase